MPRLLLFLSACVQYGIDGKEDEPQFMEDSGSGCLPSDPDCTDTATHTGDTGAPPDCEVEAVTAGTVPTLEECVATGASEGPPNPYDVVIEAFYDLGNNFGVTTKPVVTNLTDDNGDGVVDTSDIPDIVVAIASASELVALSGDGSGEIFRVSQWYGYADLVAADVDADGEVEVCCLSWLYRPQCVDATGASEWIASSPVTREYSTITACDIDQDGSPEVIADTLVLNGEDGSIAASLDATYVDSAPVCADLDLDGSAEILVGHNVYDASGAVLWSMGSGGATAMVAVAEADGDPEGEVFLVDDAFERYDHDGTFLGSTTLPGGAGGPPCVADFDGDGAVEVAVPGYGYMSLFETDGTLVWSVPSNPAAYPGCSGFDFDADGAYTVVLGGDTAFQLFDGATGAVVYEDSTHRSCTIFDYPVIADVDADGSAELVIGESCGRSGVTVYGHVTDEWPGAGRTWGIHDYTTTSLGVDGSVPVAREPGWLVDNLFRARPSSETHPTPDLFGSVVDLCVADCSDGPVRISVRVGNQGASDVDAGVSWAFYRNDAGALTLVTTGTLPAVPAGTTLASFEITVAPGDVGSDGFVVRLDDDGTGSAGIEDCDTGNQEIVWSDGVCG